MDKIVVGQRAPVAPVRLLAGTSAASAAALRLRLLRPDGTIVVVASGPTITRDPADALLWRYGGTADREGIWQWQWELDRVVLDYGRFFVRGTGFSS